MRATTGSADPKNDNGDGNVRANEHHQVELTRLLSRTYIVDWGSNSPSAASHRQRRTFRRRFCQEKLCPQPHCSERGSHSLIGR